VTGTYEMAAQLARKVGVPIEDWTVRALVQRLGARADEQLRERLQTVPREKNPTAAPGALAVVMLEGLPGAAGEIIGREQNYFTTHAGRMSYQAIAARGWPIGSGAVESACAQKQLRFKRPGPFWTARGLRHLNALIQAREHDH
jgi:hypothetical protein